MDALVACESGGVEVLDVEDNALRLVFGHPFVEAKQRRRKPPRQQHPALILALGGQHSARHVGPPKPFEEFACGVLGVVEFVEAVGGGHVVQPYVKIPS